MNISILNWDRIKDTDLDRLQLMIPKQLESFRKKIKIKMPSLFFDKENSSLPLKRIALTKIDDSTVKYDIDKLSLMESLSAKIALKNIIISQLKEFVVWERLFEETGRGGLFEEILPVNSWWFKVTKKDYQKELEQLSGSSVTEITYKDLDNFTFDISINNWHSNHYEINIVATPSKKWKEEFVLLQMGQAEYGEKEEVQDSIFLCMEITELQAEEREMVNECLCRDSVSYLQLCQLDKYRDEVVNTITNNYLTTENLSIFSEGIIDETYRGTLIKSKQGSVLGDVILAVAYEHDDKIITTITEV